MNHILAAALLLLVPSVALAQPVNPPGMPKTGGTFLGGVRMPSLDNVLYCSQFISTQACHDALPSTGGKMIMPPSTTLIVASTVAISKPNVTLECPNWTTVFKRGMSSGQLVNFTGAGGIIRNCTFDGNGTVFTGTASDLQMASSDGLVEHVQALASGGNVAVALTGVNSRITGSTITGLSSATVGGYGIWAIGGVSVTIDHNVVSGTKIDGIGFNGPGSRVTNNHVFGSQCFATTLGAAGGQLVSYLSTSAVIAANSIDPGCAGWSVGLELNGSDTTVTGNTINNQTSTGVAINPNTKGILFSGNTVANSGTSSGGGAGVLIQNGATAITITGNRIIDNQTVHTQTYGVQVTSGTQDNIVVTGNDLTGNLTGPVQNIGNGLNRTFTNNIGIDNVIPSVASSFVLLFPMNPVFILTGTTGVGWLQTVNGPIWNGRVVTMLPTGVVVFSAGNNIANSFTTVANVPVTATFDGTLWHLK